MAFNENELQKLLNMDNKAFAELITSIVKASGGNELKAKMLASNIPALKKALASMTPEEAERTFGKEQMEKAREIYKNMRG